jgi:hypothetical protein
MVTNIGEELMRQRKEKEQIAVILDQMEKENMVFRYIKMCYILTLKE